MEGDMTNIYGTSGGGLIGTALGYLVGLVILVGGFIFAARYLIGKRVRQFDDEWRASHGASEEEGAKPPPADDERPPSRW